MIRIRFAWKGIAVTDGVSVDVLVTVSVCDGELVGEGLSVGDAVVVAEGDGVFVGVMLDVGAVVCVIVRVLVFVDVGDVARVVEFAFLGVPLMELP